MTRFSPSALPGLAACPCFAGDDIPSPAAQRGIDIDAALSAILAGAPAEHPDEWAGAVAYGVEAFKRIRATMPGAKVLIHPRVTTPLSYCHGTADVALVDEEVGVVIDWKTGSSPAPASADHLQLMAYGWGLLAEHDLAHVDCYIVALDLCETTVHRLAAHDCSSLEERIEKVAADAVVGEERRTGPQCRWCARRGECTSTL